MRTGPWLTVSGQLALRDGVLVSKDPLEQARQCLANIAEILALAGMGFADVVSLTCYLTDVSAYPAYGQVKREVLGEASSTGTAIIVSGFLVPGALMEVVATAWRED